MPRNSQVQETVFHETDVAARPPAALDDLWAEFKATGDQNLRERLILHYSPLVKYVAGRVGCRPAAHIEQADLVSYGIFGLIDAIERFDPDRAIKFETYAINRIRGAIIDELRSIDWIPRSMRQQGPRGRAGLAALEAPAAPHADRAPRSPPSSASSSTSCTPSSAGSPSSTSWRSTSCSPSTAEGRQAQPGRHPRGHQGRGPGRGLREPGDQAPARPRDQHAPGAGEDRGHPLLLRGPDARRDRSGPRGSPRAASARCTPRRC